MSIAVPPHSPGQPYDQATVQLGLTTVALYEGSAARAARQLKEMGHPIPRATLESWIDGARAAEYAEILDELAPQIQRRIAGLHETFAQKAMGVADEALDRVRDTLPELPPRDAHAALRNILTSAGISSDKLMILRERPLPARAEARSPGEIIRALEGLGVIKHVEIGTGGVVDEADDLPDADVIG